jgi:hypothetical protein
MRTAVLAAIGFGTMVATFGACAPSYAPKSERITYQAAPVRRTGNTLGRVELTSVDVGRNAYDVVMFLRPSFLRGHNGTPTLAINGVLVGTATYLSSMSVDEIEEVKLLNGLDATTMFGARHNGSVLVVTTRRR